MGTIKDVMTRDVKSLSTDATITEAARLMDENDIGDILVTEKDGRLCGVLTDRDIVVRAIAEQKDPSTTRIGDVCTRDPAHLNPSSSVDDAVRMMAERCIRRLPVVENGNAIGIVSLGDLAQRRDPRSALGSISTAPPNN
jgi:CBS domain-containing protein